MNINKEYDSSCIFEGGRAVLTYKIEKISVSECEAEAQINEFLDNIYQNIKQYVTKTLPITLSENNQPSQNRSQRIRRGLSHYLLETKAILLCEKYLSVELSTFFNERHSSRYFVICTEDSVIENPESFLEYRKVKKYLKDGMILNSDGIVVFHKGKKIKIKSEK